MKILGASGRKRWQIEAEKFEVEQQQQQHLTLSIVFHQFCSVGRRRYSYSRSNGADNTQKKHKHTNITVSKRVYHHRRLMSDQFKCDAIEKFFGCLFIFLLFYSARRKILVSYFVFSWKTFLLFIIATLFSLHFHCPNDFMRSVVVVVVDKS